jgi:LPXTG-site transpeptidase (sortase) family protein
MTRLKKTSEAEEIANELFGSFVTVFRERPLIAGIMWFGVFSLLLSFSLMLGIVPDLDTDDEALATDVTITETEGEVASAVNDSDSRPVRIVIDAISLDASIETPTSTAIEVLDEALLRGVVHYPGSANLADSGNVFLFGHSSGFRVVQNQAFKAFNDLKDLKENDLVRVQSASREYVYRVTSVSLVSADEAFVDLSRSGRTLTLATCNVFGAKEERYVVKADLVGEYEL